MYGRRPDDRPVSGSASVPPGTTAFPAAYGGPADNFGQTEQYGPPPYGQTQQFGGAPYGSPSGAYPAQPSNVYGTASAPPATGYDRFDGGPGPYEETGGEPPQQKKKRLLLILAVVGAVTVLAAVVTAVVLATSGSGAKFAVGDCVKQSGKQAVKASCSDSKAYKVVNDVSKQSECADRNQPMVIVTEGKTQHVLCLRPASQK